MDIAVLGASGMIGSRVSEELEARGHGVRRLSRSVGIDAFTGEGLDAALDGADLVVDALNLQTLRAGKAVHHFTTCAQNIVRSARTGGARRVACISIVGAADPRAGRVLGYYRGKAAQERAYSAAALPTTILRSTQWFELAEQLLAQSSAGSVAVLPTMRMAPLSVTRAARLCAQEILASAAAEGDTTIAMRGPEVMTSAQLVRRILARRGEIGGRSPRFVTQAPYLGGALARGVLVPVDGLVDDLTLEAWLETEG